MRIIANEVAYAGMGMDVSVNGLDKLIKADSLLTKIRESVMHLHDTQLNISTHINGSDELARLHKNLAEIHHNIDSTVDVHTSGVNSLNDMRRDIEQTRTAIDSLKHSMTMNFHMNTGEGLNALSRQVKTVNNTLRTLKHTSNDSLGTVGRDSEMARTRADTLARTGQKLHGIFSGTFLGNAASQGFQAIVSGAKSAISTGLQLVETGDQVKKAWQNIGIGNTGAEDMVKQMDQLRDSAGMDEESIQRMQRSMYSLTGSAPRARLLTNEMVAFGKASGDSSEQIGRMGRTLPRLLSTGNVRATMFNRTLGQSPALVNAIAKASGHSKQAFEQLLQSGKMTSQQLQQYMVKASKGSAHAMDEYYSTLQGQIQAFKGMWTSAKENFSKPFVSNLSRAIDQTTKSAGGLRKVQATVAKLSTALGKRVGNYVGKAIGWLVKNQKPLARTGTAVFRILKAIGSGIWKSFSSILTGITGGTKNSTKGFDNFSKAIERLSKHTKQLQTFGRVLANAFVFTKINKFSKAIAGATAKLASNNKIGRILGRSTKALGSSWQQSGRTAERITTRLKISMARLGTTTSRLTHPISSVRAGFTRLGVSARALGVKMLHPINMAKSGFARLRTSTRSVGYVMVMAFNRGASRVKAFTMSLRGATIKEKLAKLGTLSLRGGITGLSLATRGFSLALRAVPIVGWIQLAIDGITEIYMHSAKFRKLVNPMLHFIGWSIGKIGNGIADAVNWVIRAVKWMGRLTGKITGLFHRTRSGARSTSSSMNRYTRNSETVYASAQRRNVSNTRRAHASIDSYRRNSSGKFRAYISRNGKIYKNYHKGLTRISETTYKQREALRKRYYTRYEQSLKKYEANYKKYESRRSALSRKYGKLRAMYSVKSLRLIEKRFKRLKTMVTRYARTMFKDTQRYFKRIGTGAGRQFRNIYRDVRKYLGRSNREATKQFKTLYKNSRKWLNGSVNKYVKELRYRQKKQRYYDRQLVKQAKATGKAMYRLPLGWIKRETKDLISNWRRQRASFTTHNRRMTHAEETHLNSMTQDLESFTKHFEKLMSDMEDNVFGAWSKFWAKMYDKAGSGMNAVQRPLNTGAEHINSFVRAFGETSSPMSTMPSISYATGTGFRRPITQMVNATLNDGIDSPETGNQETVIHPDGNIEFPQGRNIQKILEPGTEVLNATETRLMSEMANFAPTVHLATGTGALNKLVKNVYHGGSSSMNIDNGMKSLSHIIKNNVTNNGSSIPAIHLANGTGSLGRIIKNNYNSVVRSPISNITNSAMNPISPKINVSPVINVTPKVHLASGTGDLSKIINNQYSSVNPIKSELSQRPALNIMPKISLASGTGAFGGLFAKMGNWIKSAMNGTGSGDTYTTIWNQAKGRGDNKLLHVLQAVLSKSEQVLSGFMGSAPTGYQGVMGDITKGVYGSTANQIDSWWKALMNLTNQALNQGASGPVLKFAEQFAKGKHYVFGGTGAGGAYDCSGFVQAVLAHYGVNAPRTSGAQINSFPHISRSQARPGDLVGNGGHIGIVADNGAHNYFSAFSPSEGIRMFPLTSTYWDGGPMIFARVPKLAKMADDQNPSFSGANKGLMAFVKHQEASYLKFISDKLAPLLDANPGGTGVARWRPFVVKALKANGFSANSSEVDAWMRVIARESNGDPHAVNHWDSNAKAGHPSEGLVQTIMPTFEAYKFPGHDNIFSGYDDLLAGIHYMAAKYGRGPSAFARVSGPEGYMKGGHFHAGQLMTVGERGEELIKPDFSGKVIPHGETKRILNKNNNQPVKVNQNITVNVKDGSTSSQKTLLSTLNKSGDELADKLASLLGFNEGGLNI